MEKSQTITKIAEALTKFQSEVQTVKKDGANPFFRSKYATLENVIETVREPLKKVGLSFSQFPTGENELVTILMHESGEYLQSSVKMAPKENTPQGQGSAITYMRRYSLSAVLGLATEEDDDGNTASRQTKQPEKKIDYKEKLKAVKTIEELKKVWASIPAVAKKELEALKDTLKRSLEKESRKTNENN